MFYFLIFIVTMFIAVFTPWIGSKVKHFRMLILKGSNNGFYTEIENNIGRIKKYTDLPTLAGFGIKTTEDIKHHLSKVDGAMIGRAVYHSPYFLTEIERDIFNNEKMCYYG